MEGSAKITFSRYLLSNAFANRSREGLGSKLGTIFATNCSSEVASNTDVINYAYREGSEWNYYPPPKIWVFGPQEEGSGRYSLTRRATPDGVGGF